MAEFNQRLSHLLQLLQIDVIAQQARWREEDAQDRKRDHKVLLSALSANRKGINDDMKAEFEQLKADLLQGRKAKTASLDMAYVFAGTKKASVLGAGAVAVTYRMRGKADNVLYAVKIINIDRVKRLGLDAEKMRRESRMLLALNHRNIIRYFASRQREFEDHDGDTVREYCVVM
jgi:hypothetical protein